MTPGALVQLYERWDVSVMGRTWATAEASHLLLLHKSRDQRLESKRRVTRKSWGWTQFCGLEKHWVFHTIFKHKMFIFLLFNLYNFSGFLVPLTLSVYKGRTIQQAIAT